MITKPLLLLSTLLTAVSILAIVSCTESAAELDLSGLHIGDEITLRYWMPEPPTNIVKFKMAEHHVYQKLEEVTGVKVEFVYPSSPDTERQLTLLREADDLPDILEWNWRANYPGGPDAAIDDGMILPLRDLFVQHAPNLYKILSDNEEALRSVTTGSGRFYVFPSLNIDLDTRAQSGLMIRRDWIEKLEIAVPSTIADWRDMMRAMKETDFGTAMQGSEYPFFIPVFGNFSTGDVWFYYLEESNAFASAWGVSHTLYRDESHRVVYGPIQPGYRDMLYELNRWYSEGLIHPWLGNPGGRNFYDLIAKSGATIGSYDFLSYLQPFRYVQAPPATLADNTVPLGSELNPIYSGWRSAAISATSPNAVEAAQWLDVAYGGWGARLFNYGIEDESYRVEEDQPLLIDSMLQSYESAVRNKSELSSKFMKYSRILLSGPFESSGSLVKVLNRAYLKSQSALDPNPWLLGARTPPTNVLLYDAGRRSDFNRLMNPVRTHARSNLAAFILGERSLEEFDEYVREIEELGIGDAISLIYNSEADFLTKVVY